MYSRIRSMSFTPSIVAVLLVLLPSIALCNVEFTRPKASDSFAAGEKFTVQWRTEDPTELKMDGAQAPHLINKGGTYALELCTGSNVNIIPLKTVAKDAKLQMGEGWVDTKVDADVGEDGHAYFFRITISSPIYDDPLISYSPRFSLTSMSGTFPASVRAANAAEDVNPPPARIPLVKRQLAAPVNPVVAPGAGEAAPAAEGFDVPYSLQTGVAKFAPMQPQPGTEITAKTVKRQYPTSSVSIFTTIHGPAKQTTTNIQPITYKLTSVINNAAPAPMPEDDMAKYLKRWADDPER